MSGDEVGISTPVQSAILSSLPPIWINNPTVWFSYIESLFCTRNVKSQLSRFHLVVAALPPDVTIEISDILVSPPNDCPYDFLKAEIIRRLSVSDERRLKELLHNVNAGDRSPSQLLTHMKHLAGSLNVGESVMRSIWLQHIPPNVRAILVSLDDSVPLESLARTADKIASVCSLTVSAVANNIPTLPSTSQQVPTEWSEVMDRLISRLDSMETRISAMQRTRSMNRSRSHNRPRSSSKGRSKLCWYHYKHGKNAFQCVPPCAWNERTSGSTQSENFTGAQ